MLCDLLLRSWSLMLHHPWWAYEKIFDQTGDQTFWSIWVSFGESSFKKIRLVSLCAGCPPMFGKPHVFFGTADEPSSSGSPSPAHKRSILSRHVVFLSQEQGEEILLLGSCISGMCQISAFQELPRFRSWN